MTTAIVFVLLLPAMLVRACIPEENRLTKPAMSAFQEEALLAHNNYRAKHGVPGLKMSDGLCKHAQMWADHLAQIESLQYSQSDFGENLAMYSSRQTTEYSGQQVTDQWYSEVKKYNFNDQSGFQSNTGHFSQVVWKDSKEFGIGKAVSRHGAVYVVANYNPAGNMMRGYQDNVFPPQSSVRDTTSAGGKDDTRGLGEREHGFYGRRDVTGHGVGTAGNQFQKEALILHNEYRSKHGVDSLTLSRNLCESAQDWAEHLAQSGLLEHSRRRDIGENLAMHYSPATTEYSAKEVCDQWYSEMSKYDFERPGFGSRTGHFTQMVWKGSKEFGIGKAVAKDGKVMVVGQYRPPGNIVGRYEENVFPRPDGYRPSPSAA